MNINDMKQSRWVAFSLAVAGLLMLGSCRHHAPGEDEVQTSKLSGTWIIVSATKDNVVQDFSGMTLVLSGGANGSNTYAALHRPGKSPWPASGTWSFGATMTSQLIRDQGTPDELPVTYQVTDSELELGFQFSGSGYARSLAAEGQWVFKFHRQ